MNAWLAWETDVLELHPNCEACNRDLPPDSPEAMICSFECTFCTDCVRTRLAGRCPNCGGELQRRPIRPADSLAHHPASTRRVFRPLAGTPSVATVGVAETAAR